MTAIQGANIHFELCFLNHSLRTLVGTSPSMANAVVAEVIDKIDAWSKTKKIRRMLLAEVSDKTVKGIGLLEKGKVNRNKPKDEISINCGGIKATIELLECPWPKTNKQMEKFADIHRHKPLFEVSFDQNWFIKDYKPSFAEVLFQTKDVKKQKQLIVEEYGKDKAMRIGGKILSGAKTFGNLNDDNQKKGPFPRWIERKMKILESCHGVRYAEDLEILKENNLEEYEEYQLEYSSSSHHNCRLCHEYKCYELLRLWYDQVFLGLDDGKTITRHGGHKEREVKPFSLVLLGEPHCGKTSFFTGLCNPFCEDRILHFHNQLPQKSEYQQDAWLLLLDDLTPLGKNAMNKLYTLLRGELKINKAPCVVLTKDPTLFQKLHESKSLGDRCFFLNLKSLSLLPETVKPISVVKSVC